jgi:CheY-like chemotaxis protein
MSGLVTVLIIDDNANMRKTLRNVLAEIECSIEEAETGEEALERIASQYFDLVFVDNKLPGDDGIDVIRKVRESNLGIGRIFLLTGYPAEGLELEAGELGVFYFKNKKDIELGEMRNKINEAIGAPAL